MVEVALASAVLAEYHIDAFADVLPRHVDVVLEVVQRHALDDHL